MKDNATLRNKQERLILKAKVSGRYDCSLYLITYDREFHLETIYEEIETKDTSLERILEVMFQLIDEENPNEVSITMIPMNELQQTAIEQAYKAWRERSNG